MSTRRFLRHILHRFLLRITPRLLFILSLLIIALGGIPQAQAQQPTPTNTPSPTATSIPTPYTVHANIRVTRLANHPDNPNFAVWFRWNPFIEDIPAPGLRKTTVVHYQPAGGSVKTASMSTSTFYFIRDAEPDTVYTVWLEISDAWCRRNTCEQPLARSETISFRTLPNPGQTPIPLPTPVPAGNIKVQNFSHANTRVEWDNIAQTVKAPYKELYYFTHVVPTEGGKKHTFRKPGAG